MGSGVRNEETTLKMTHFVFVHFSMGCMGGGVRKVHNKCTESERKVKEH